MSDRGPSASGGEAGAGALKPARRAVWAVAVFSVGLTAGHWGAIWPSAWSLTAAAVLAAAAIICRGMMVRVLLALAMFALGVGVYQFRIAEIPSDSIAHRLSREGVIVTLEGRVASEPRVTPALRGRFAHFARPDALKPVTRFEFRAERLIENGADADSAARARPVSGRLWARVDSPATTLRAGDAVRITGVAALVDPPSNPGEPDHPALARQRGIVGRISIATADLVVALPSDGGWIDRSRAALTRGLASLRARAGSWLEEPIEGASGRANDREARALLLAMLLGERSPDVQELGDAFTRLGIAHILAISGMNLVVLASAATLLLRLIGERPVLQPMLVAASVLVYLLLIPAESPILRAAIMVLAFMLADACGRRYDRLTILAWTMLITLLWRPLDLFAPGFQLSYAIVAGLILFAHATRERLFGARPERDTYGVIRWVIEGAKDLTAASLVAWLIASPIAAHHMGTFSPLGVLTTLLIAPFASLLMAGGYVTLILGIISPALAGLVSPALIALSSLIARGVHVLDGAPGTVVYLPALPMWLTLLVLGAVVWWLVPRDAAAVERAKENATDWAAMRRRLRVLSAARLAASVLVAGALAFSLVNRGIPSGTVLRIDVFDVGDGSCWLLRSGDESMLFDAGSNWPAIGEAELPRAIRAVGAWRVPRAIVSHPNLDHYNAMPDLTDRLGVREVLVNPMFSRAMLAPVGGGNAPRGPSVPGAIGLLSAELHRRGVRPSPLAAGDTLTLGRAAIRVLSPRADDDFRRDNDTSLVLLVSIPTEAGERRLLLCGDIQDEAIATLNELEPDLRADIIEAPHHGSARPAGIEFVGRVAPPGAVVVQSTGPSRLNDDRWAEVRAERRWLSTAAGGAVTVEVRASDEIVPRSFSEARASGGR